MTKSFNCLPKSLKFWPKPFIFVLQAPIFGRLEKSPPSPPHCIFIKNRISLFYFFVFSFFPRKKGKKEKTGSYFFLFSFFPGKKEKKWPNTHQKPIKYWWNTDQIPIQTDRNTHQKLIKFPLNIDQIPIKYPSNTHQIPIKYWSNTHQILIKYPSNMIK